MNIKEQAKVWGDIPYSPEKYNEMIQLIDSIKTETDILLVIGIGGSYLGAKAVIDTQNSKYKQPKVVFLSNATDEATYLDTVDYLKDKRVAVNYVSLSGTTYEPLRIYERILKENCINISKIIFTVGENVSVDRGEVDHVIRVDQNMSGRYSVFSPIGMFPIGYNADDTKQAIYELLRGARSEDDRVVYSYVAKRTNGFIRKGKKIEFISCNSDRLVTFTKWYQQLIAESEGKCNAGLLPVDLLYPKDLHSVEQYIQEGPKVAIELFIKLNDNKLTDDITNAVIQAHSEATDISIVEINDLSYYTIGKLMSECEYIAYYSVMQYRKLVRGYDANPFNQNGVQLYKSFLNNNKEA